MLTKTTAPSPPLRDTLLAKDMPKIYFYKLTVDDGGAPCVEKDLLSLSICKPMIRRTARAGDLIVGFAANSLYADNRLIYVARVNEKLVNGDYYRSGEYQRRGDCIYEWKGLRMVSRPRALYHSSAGDLTHDLGQPPDYHNANTLFSREFCYFGSAGSSSYKLRFPIIAKAVEALGQGHRVHHDEKLLSALELAVSNGPLDRAEVHGKATSGPCRGVSHRGGG